MEYGITANGFSMRRLDEIYNASCKRFEDEIGVNPSENPQSVMNVLFTIFSDAPAEMWEAFAASYQQLFPNTAEGIALDNAMQIGGVNRIGQARTKYMLDSKDRWRAMCGLSDSVLDALSKSAAELLVICKDTENFRDEAVKSAEKAEKDKEASAANALAADKSAKKASESEGVASQKAENAKEAAEASNKSAEEASKSAAGALASEQAASESARLSSISEAASKDAMNGAKDFSNSASKSAREALESKRAAEDAANSASESSLAAASSERTATEKAAESSELAIRTEKNAELSKESSETAIKAAAEAKKALSMLSFAFGIDDEGRFSLFAKKSIT